MPVVRARSVTENRVLGGNVASVRIEPGVDVLGLDLNNVAIISSCRDFCSRFLGERGKRQQFLARNLSERPQTRDEHVLCRCGLELKSDSRLSRRALA